jgi:hypothetical protein
VRLWDSRFDCDAANGDDDDDDDGAGVPKPRTHLATFDCFPRWVHVRRATARRAPPAAVARRPSRRPPSTHMPAPAQSIAVLDGGKYVRPEGDMDLAMFSAAMKKAAREGSAALVKAARAREIIKCSGSFATASKNDKAVRVWEMAAAADQDREEGAGARAPDDDAATLTAAHVLEHDHAVTALAATKKRIFLGDATGVVVLWERQEGLFASLCGKGGDWTKVRKFTPWKAGALVPPEDMLEQEIVRLCVMGDALVAGGKSGVVRVWDALGDLEDFEAHKKEHASSVKVASGALVGIAGLPPVEDPATGEARRAFAVAAPDGRVASLALHPREDSAKSELAMFHAHALPCAVASLVACDVKDASRQVLLAGDVDGNIHVLKLEGTAATGA